MSIQALNTLSSHLATSSRMPVLFVGHGNPLYAITQNQFAMEWDNVGKSLPRPQVIVVISAHWLTRGTYIQSAKKPDTIHDFFGFPPELFAVQYTAPGDPLTAEILQKQFAYAEARLDAVRGFDHGMWSIMLHISPTQTIPVLQISLDMTKSFNETMDMFAVLRPLRDRGVLFVGSGNIIHNLMDIHWDKNTPHDWALEFDEKITHAITDKNHDILTNPYTLGSASRLAIPTDDHYRPMLACMSLIDTDENIRYFTPSIDMGSISMRSFITE